MAVYDQSYQRWGGEFRQRRLRWLPMVRYHIALALKRKIVWLILFLAIVPSLGFSGVIYFSTEAMSEMMPVDVDQLGQISPQNTGNPLVERFVAEFQERRGLGNAASLTRADKYWIATRAGAYFFLLVPQSFVVLLVTSVIGASLIAQDVRSNALEIYLTKPITPLDYLLGKLAVIGTFILLTTFLPSMLVFMTASATWKDYFEVAWPIVPRLFGICLMASFVNGIFMLGLSSLAKSARYATVIWFALCLVSALAAFVLSAVTENELWLFFGYRNNFSYLISEMLGGDLMINEVMNESVEVSIFLPIAILGGVVIASIAILRKTLRAAENR